MTPSPSELPNLLTGMNESTPSGKPFLISTKTLKYGEYRDRVNRTRSLFRRRGLEPGDRIILGTQSDEAVAIIYAAAILSGLTTAVIDPQCSASEANVLIAKSQPKLALLDAEIIDRSKALHKDSGPALVAIAQAAKERTGFGLIIRRKETNAESYTETFPALLEAETPYSTPTTTSSDTTALILFTSGTTSQPKGVELTHGNLAAQLETFRRQYGYTSADRFANHLPFHHTDGINQGPLLALAMGATLIRPPSVTMQNLGDILDWIYSNNATHLITVPSVLAMMMRLPEQYNDSFQSEQFRFIASTAGYLEDQLWREFETRFHTMVVNSYGLTETVSEALYCGPTEETRKIGTVGKPVDCEAKIVNNNGREVAANETGLLLLQGANIMPRYFNNPEATVEVFQNSWLITGDLATRDDDGFFRIVGRAKNVIIKGGVNIYPEDVTSGLLLHPGVKEAVTIGLADSVFREKVVSCIVPTDSQNPPTIEQLLDHCREVLSPEKVPGDVLFFEALPRGPAGKIELSNMKRMAEARKANAQDALGEIISHDDKILAIAGLVFHQPADNLSSSSSPENTPGWDSLAFLEFIVSLETNFGITLSPRDIMSIHTIGDAQHILCSMVRTPEGVA